MIHATILTTRGTTFGLDILEANEPDVIGAGRIVPGNISGSVKITITGQAEVEATFGRTLGPMHNGDTVTSTDPRFSDEVLRVLGINPAEVSDYAKEIAVVPLHDRYESPAQYAMLSV